jgi:hypothetical protein
LAVRVFAVKTPDLALFCTMPSHTIIILSEGGDDYSATMESLTFAPGNDTIPHCVTVPILSDIIAEGQEFFLGNLESNGDRVTLSPQETTITILDNDGKKYLNGIWTGPHL